MKNSIRHLAVVISVLLGLGCSMSKYPAERFFDGPALVAARAIAAGDDAQLPQLLKDVDLDEPGREEMTLLWFAMLNQNFEAMRLLVSLGVEPEEHGIDGLGTAVAYALHQPDIRYLMALLDGGLSPDHLVEDDTSLLQRAAGADGATLAHVKLVVERGAELEAKDSLGETALIAAINTHQPDRAFYLVEQGADVNTFNQYGATAMYAVELVIESQDPGPLRQAYERLRDEMIARGAKYPANPPAEVRTWMRSQGMKVVN